LAILAIWQLAIIAIFVARIDTSAPAMLVFRSLALEFGLGMLVGWLVTTAPKIPTAAARVTAWGCVAFGAALIPISATLLAQAPRFSTFGVAGALLVYGFATLERGDLIRAPGWMEQIGDASYAVYLIHFSAITLLVTVLTHMHVKGFAVYLAPLVSAFGFLVGEGFYLLVDKPLGRALRLPLRPRPNAQPAT
jgi:peptidoglycan/LPS O-acetylase OafA/YrhL